MMARHKSSLPLKILHFADAHIDMANYGRHDPQSGLPVRVIDFLRSLDTIIDAAVAERVDLVIFAGDAYKDRNPAPTFQREWGRRIMRLSRAGIPTLLLVGNHDLSPALNRAHALDPFVTLDVPNVWVVDRPAFLRPSDLQGLPVQVIALPWISRSGFMAAVADEQQGEGAVYEGMVERLVELIENWLDAVDPALPVILTAHCSVQGASYGGERSVMLGKDLVLPGSLVKDTRLDYVALGHIHKPQNLNENQRQPFGYDHPPVIYPGSIERVDFGEAADRKYYVTAQVARGQTEIKWCELTDIRPFIDRFVRLEQQSSIHQQLLDSLPSQEALEGSIVRLVVEYPREWEPLIDEGLLRQRTSGCLEFHLVKRPQMQSRIRLPGDHPVGSLTPLELLDLYWRASHAKQDDLKALNNLASSIIQGEENSPEGF
jgi:DNA repair protein SbcD/Mre11